MLVGKKALYILNNEEKSVEWIGTDHLNRLIMSWQAGIGATYNLGNSMAVFLETNYRSQISSQYKDYALIKKFQLFNIKTGIFVRL